jgi:cystathionine beta-synthase
MIDNGFMEDNASKKNEWWSNKSVADLKLQSPYTVGPNVTCAQCVEICKKTGYDQLPCVSSSGVIEGMVTSGGLSSLLTSGRVQPSDPITKALYRQYAKLSVNTPLASLSRIFDKDHFALVTQTQKFLTVSDKGEEEVQEKTMVFGVVTRIDLLNFLVSNQPSA